MTRILLCVILLVLIGAVRADNLADSEWTLQKYSTLCEYGKSQDPDYDCWDSVVLVYGFGDDYEACEDIVKGLLALDSWRNSRLRCVPGDRRDK